MPGLQDPTRLKKEGKATPTESYEYEYFRHILVLACVPSNQKKVGRRIAGGFQGRILVHLH